ncbi:hypothetical protein JCM1840_001823 [Sporobolomyces johnsonii]
MPPRLVLVFLLPSGARDVYPTLVTQISSHLTLGALLSVSLVSKPLRAFILSPSCETVWLLAVEALGLPELEAPLRPVELASLVVGRWCQVCGKSTARKVDFSLRIRLCSKCWEEQQVVAVTASIVFEGPDEPDPAFEDFFPGTKRYTPRSRTGKSWKKHKAFFHLPTLVATSSLLSSLLTPQLEAFEAAVELDPLAEVDDFLMLRNLPDDARARLDERAEWVKRVWRARRVSPENATHAS